MGTGSEQGPPSPHEAPREKANAMYNRKLWSCLKLSPFQSHTVCIVSTHKKGLTVYNLQSWTDRGVACEGTPKCLCSTPRSAIHSSRHL